MGQGRQPQGAFGPEDQIRLGRLAAVCDGPHVDHQRCRVHLVVVLPHAGPAQLAVGDAVEIKGALCRGQAVDGVAGGEARPLRVLLQGGRPQLLGDLGEGHVAAVGKGGGDVLLPVGAGADDGLVPDLDAARTGPGPLHQVRDLLQRRRQGHGLVHGPRRESGGQEAVQIGALIPVIGLDVLRYVQGVVAGGGDHAQDLPGLVVIDRHSAGVAPQGLVGGVIVPGVDGQVQIIPLLGAEGTV